MQETVLKNGRQYRSHPVAWVLRKSKPKPFSKENQRNQRRAIEQFLYVLPIKRGSWLLLDRRVHRVNLLNWRT
jgi:hypothetical protein